MLNQHLNECKTVTGLYEFTELCIKFAQSSSVTEECQLSRNCFEKNDIIVLWTSMN